MEYKKNTMDNKNIIGKQDRSRIDANDKSEVEYVHRQFPHLQHQDVLDAIKKYGPDREDVMNQLKQKKSRQ